MELVTVYHHDAPVARYPLDGSRVTIGSTFDNDVVLAGDHVAERHLVLYRDEQGLWRARPSDSEEDTRLDFGSRLAVGGLALSLETAADSTPCPKSEVAEGSSYGIVGSSVRTQLLRLCIQRLGPLRGAVLIQGDTGTGKELVAKALHQASGRSGAFVAVNCGGLTSSLLEDTLFGHEKGSFTGATHERRGVFEQAHGGTLFLDEIGEIPLPQQASLLRVLDDHLVRRVGGQEERRVDFRLVTATNRHLEHLAQDGRFRLDLFHRLSILRITTAPLRDRPDDIEPLAAHFLANMAHEVGHKRLSGESMKRLRECDLAGNARELRNRLYRAAVFARGSLIRVVDLDLEDTHGELRRRKLLLSTISDQEIDAAVQRHCGNIASAAKELGVPRTSLRDRLQRTAAPNRPSAVDQPTIA